MKGSKKPSIYDVAKHAGVSPSTVSRFLNRTTLVSREKSSKIELALAEVGYQVPTSGAGINNARTMTIGALIQDLDSPYSNYFFNSMQHVLISRGYSLHIAAGFWNNDYQVQSMDYFIRNRVDGIIVVTGSLREEQLKHYASKVPLVVVGMKSKAKNSISLCFDNVLVGYMATLHLIQYGHSRIAHIKGKGDQPDAAARHQGYLNALTEAGLAINEKLIVTGNFSLLSGYENTLALLDSGEPFSAIFCANDQMAYGAIKAITSRGLRVPEDISVIGVDDLATSSYFTPSLTTLRQPIEKMGMLCADAIFHLLHGAEFDIRLPPIELIIRDSTARVG